MNPCLYLGVPLVGATPVFITTYIPFFVGAYLTYNLPPKKQLRVIGTLVTINVLLLVVLVPLGVI